MVDDPNAVNDPNVGNPGTVVPDPSIVQGKMVPESDLIAIKTSLETKVTELTNNNEAQQTAFAAKHQEALQLQAKVEELTKANDGSSAANAELDTAKKQIETLTTDIGTVKGELTETKRNLLITVYGVDVEVIKDYTLEQLMSLEAAAKVFKVVGPGKNPIDNGDGTLILGSRSSTEKMQSGWNNLHPNDS